MCGFNSLVFSAGDVAVKCNHHVLNNRAIFMVQVFELPLPQILTPSHFLSKVIQMCYFKELVLLTTVMFYEIAQSTFTF